MRDNIYATDSDRSVAYGHIQSQNCIFVDYRNWNSAKMGYTNKGNECKGTRHISDEHYKTNEPMKFIALTL